MIDYLMRFDFTGLMGICLYWVPMAFCVFGYMARTFERYRECCEARDKGSYFVSDTVGTLIGRTVVTFLPGANLLAASFDLAPSLFFRFFQAIGKMFDVPLVRKIEK